MKLLLKIKYDGTSYCGFQFQPEIPTVQGTLTECLSRSFGFPCTVTGCSRTDAGVHALGYCAAVEPRSEDIKKKDWCTVPAGRVHYLINPILPKDISVVGACFVDDSFHPRYDVISKEYIYLIEDTVCPDPFTHGRVYHVKQRITDEGISVMNRCAEVLMGTHEFDSFMAAGSKICDTTRNLMHLSAVRRDDGIIKITAEADGFLYNMVRILAGTLMDCARGKLLYSDMEGILKGKDRSLAGATAPASGLYLNRVEYSKKTAFESV